PESHAGKGGLELIPLCAPVENAHGLKNENEIEGSHSKDYIGLCVKLTEKVVEQSNRIETLERGQRDDDRIASSVDDVASLQMELIAKLHSTIEMQRTQINNSNREMNSGESQTAMTPACKYAA
ncbi:hypothetical protein ACHAWF_006089, partial [Thalassiosira exigua]